jgi:TRAP-type uncharacterized transport system substrate-binding protein
MPSLLHNLAKRTVVLIGATIVLAVIALAAILLVIIGPAPPRTITMATGAEGSAQQKFAEQYRALLAARGVELRLLATEGSVDNLQRLNDPSSGVSVGFVQAGLTTPEDAPDLVSLGTVFYEPVWVLYKGELSGRSSELFRGKRLSIGPEGSGTRRLALDLLAAIGVNLTGVDLHHLPDQDVASAFRDGELDAAVIVAPWESTVVQQLLTSEQINAATFPRADAQVALRPFLYKVILPEGVADLARNKPPRDLVLVAPKTSLVVRKDLHPALQYLLLDAAFRVHSTPGVFQKAGQFPAAEPIDLPLGDEARQYYLTGPPFLQRYLPFWLAVLAGRLLVVLIPVIAVIFPLVRLLPAAYGWAVRRRVFTLYGELKFIEAEMEVRASDVDVKDLLDRLQRLEIRANHLRVPTAFTHFLYTLRIHIGLVRSRLQQPKH